MKHILQWLTEWLKRVCLLVIFALIVVSIIYFADHQWHQVLETRSEFVGEYTIDRVETVFCKASIRSRYIELGKQRYDNGTRILNAIQQYERISAEIWQTEEQFRQSIGDMTKDEAIQMIETDKHIQTELIPARSIYRDLIQQEESRETLRKWLDEQAQLDILGAMEREMRKMKESIVIGNIIMSSEQIDNINRLIATSAMGRRNDPVGAQQAKESVIGRHAPMLLRALILFTPTEE